MADPAEFVLDPPSGSFALPAVEAPPPDVAEAPLVLLVLPEPLLPSAAGFADVEEQAATPNAKQLFKPKRRIRRKMANR